MVQDGQEDALCRDCKYPVPSPAQQPLFHASCPHAAGKGDAAEEFIFWGSPAKGTGVAKLQEWLCWSRLKVELSQQPPCRAGHQQIPWAAISTCTQKGFINHIKETPFILSSIPEKQSCVHSLQKPRSAQKMFVLPLTRTHETWLWFALEIVTSVSIWVETN